MSTRVTNSIACRRAREALIQLLFPKESSIVKSTSPSSGCQTDRNSGSAGKDSQRYSYSQLRAVYLQKLQEMHPDKIIGYQKKDRQCQSDESTTDHQTAHVKFIELKHKWEEFDSVMKEHAKISNNVNHDYELVERGHFTMFGVGCSFADSPTERELRNEIMEQACRGWFSSGSLAARDKSYLLDRNIIHRNKNNETKSNTTGPIKLSDESNFVSRTIVDIYKHKNKDDVINKCLVQNVRRFNRKVR